MAGRANSGTNANKILLNYEDETVKEKAANMPMAAAAEEYYYTPDLCNFVSPRLGRPAASGKLCDAVCLMGGVGPLQK